MYIVDEFFLLCVALNCDYYSSLHRGLIGELIFHSTFNILVDLTIENNDCILETVFLYKALTEL